MSERTDYTPTTEEVFIMWECLLWEGIASEGSMKDADWDGDRMRAQLSRWLNQVKAEAWDEGQKSHPYFGANPYRKKA